MEEKKSADYETGKQAAEQDTHQPLKPEQCQPEGGKTASAAKQKPAPASADKKKSAQQDAFAEDAYSVDAAEAENASNDSAADAVATPVVLDIQPTASVHDRVSGFFAKVWDYIKYAKVELIVIAAMIALDLITKALVAAFMTKGQTITVIPNFFGFHFTHNKNAAFGSAFGLDKLLGEQGIRIFFIVFTCIAMVIFAFMLYKFRNRSMLGRISLALILAGAVGNLVDRIAYGYVRDFIEFSYFGCTLFGSTSFAIFNIADAALTIGVVLFAVFFIFKYNTEEEKKAAASRAVGEASVDGLEASAKECDALPKIPEETETENSRAEKP